MKYKIKFYWRAWNMHIDTGLSFAQCKVMLHLKDLMEGEIK